MHCHAFMNNEITIIQINSVCYIFRLFAAAAIRKTHYEHFYFSHICPWSKILLLFLKKKIGFGFRVSSTKSQAMNKSGIAVNCAPLHL